MKNKAYLFILSFLNVIPGVVLCIRQAALHINPVSDPSFLIPGKQWEYAPEIDGIVYLSSLLVLIFGTILLYFVYSKAHRTFSIALESKSLVFLMLTSAGLSSYFVYSVVYPPFFAPKYVFVFFASLFVCIHILYFYVTKNKISGYVLNSILVSIYAVILVTIVGKLTGGMFAPTGFLHPKFIDILKQNSFLFVDSIVWWHFVLVSAVLVSIRKFRNHIDKIPAYVICLLIALLIGVIVPGEEHDYDYFIGPVNDELHGKSLLVDSPSQYGLLVVYALAAIFHFIPLTYVNFFWVLYFLTVIGYITVYRLFLYLTKSKTLSLFAVFFSISLMYFAQITNILYLPQVTFLRFGWWIVFSWYLTKIRNFMIESFILTASFFWGLDSGIYMVGGVVVYILISSLIRTNTLIDSIRMVFYRVALSVAVIVLGFFFLTLFPYLIKGKFADWRMFYQDTAMYSGGFGMIPITNPIGPYLLVIAVYVAAVLYILFVLVERKHRFTHLDKGLFEITAFLSGYGMFQFLYFTGRSHPNNLHHVLLPALLILFMAISRLKLLDVFRLNTGKASFSSVPGIVFQSSMLLIVFMGGVFLVTVTSVNTISAFSARGKYSVPFVTIENDPHITAAVQYINTFLTSASDDAEIAIISGRDTYFLMETDTMNTLNANIIRYFLRNDQIENLARQIEDRKPAILFVDHNTSYEQVQILKKYAEKDYEFRQRAGYLDVFRRIADAP